MIGHLFDQGPSIAATLGLLVTRKGGALPDLPGPTLTDSVPPRPRALVDDFVRTVGGDPARWAGRLPPHLFPQWGWPVLVRCLHGLPYDLTKAVNAGFRWTTHAPLPVDEPLELSARLVRIDDDGRRALLEVELTTSTKSAPGALTSTMVVYVPSAKKRTAKEGAEGGSDTGKRRDKERDPVPADAVVVDTRDLAANLGWHFALLTGDFNPIHWIPLAGKAAGFGGVILHGFGTAAVAAEALIAHRLDGDPTRLRHLEARFVSPVKLPARVTISTRTPEGPAPDGRTELYVGPAGGGPAQLVGAFHV